ncbi:hypothetical protein G5I_09203 [Acromyrmex echinatior]|uniref:Uncharacterized protein n=1 Tax=Acromyrmex echinatior TaxID=103372 RepID=F4WTQ4_ACREC|nr:hypothetical protein G5I_09203 [Acromyrmex echinatior]
MGCLVRITKRRRPWGWPRDRMRNDEDEDRRVDRRRAKGKKGGRARERWFDLSFPHKGVSAGMNRSDDEDGAGKFVRREGDIKGEDEGYQSPEKPRTQPPPTV